MGNNSLNKKGERTGFRRLFVGKVPLGLGGGYIRCCGHGRWRVRSYPGSLFANAPKVTKRSLPHHSAPRLGSVCPHSGLNPWAAATGHPWPNAANPASCRVTHGFKPAFGHTEPKRGAEWWGKSPLVTLGLFQSDPP